MSIATGSSPLTRGSHEGSVVGDAHGRIIPARAGFTRRPSSRYSPRWDHPRSRGVHRRARRARRRARGSSPLARGSPGHRVREPQRCRIIPARAGFTQAGGVLDRLLADHPRSRGVHLTAMSAARSSAGSSPLARGSLNRQLRESNLSGIIPARAGFTSRTRASRLLWSDHPRSRGVHDILDVLSGHASGSSPLARGSPHLPWGRRRRGRDHPRSRGVHVRCADPWVPPLGSSPLARGSRERPRRRRLGPRIIPARAGFT